MKKVVLFGILSALVLTAVGCGSGEADAGPAPAFGSKAGPPGQAAGAGGQQPTATPQVNSAEAK